MILFSRKLTRPFNENKPEALSASLRDFQSKISGSIARIGSELGSGPKKWFDLINATSVAFAKMVVEVDHPMSKWGERLTDEYLNHTLNILNLLNSVSASLSHLRQARVTMSHALTLIGNSPFSASEHLIKKVPWKYRRVDLEPDRSTRIIDRPDSATEVVLLKALCLSRGVETLSIGFVLSKLGCDAEPYMDIRTRVGGEGCGDVSVIIKELDSRFCKEVINFETECVLAVTSVGMHRSESTLEDLTTKLELLGNSIEGLEKQSSNMFYVVLATRNKLMDNLRLT